MTMPSSDRLARLARRLVLLLPVGALLFLTSCGLIADEDTAKQDTFRARGPQAEQINDLAIPVFITGGVVGILVFAALGVVIWKFRAKRFAEDDVPTQLHGNTKLEIAWTIVPALLLATFAVPTVNVVFDLADHPEEAMVIDVVGQQWWWEFSYPDYGIVTANDIVFPAGEPVVVRITSRDVIHSFWLPRLNGKRDAVPGRIHELTIEADEPGEFWGICTEFCGLSHANMRIRGTALSQEDWEAWVENQQREAVEPTDEAAVRGQETFTTLCAQCHNIRGVAGPDGASAQVAGAAPDLTHLMSRTTFAGAMFDLKREDCDVEPSGPTGTPVECLNRGDLEAWLRDPPGMKPMAPDDARGMPDLGLSEDQIDDLVAYLSTLD